MKLKLIPFLLLSFSIQAQEKIGNFVSVEPLFQSSDFVIPSTHLFQKIIEEGDSLTKGGFLPGNNDFTGYVPINGSSENGYLSINAELVPGAVSILDINFNKANQLWQTTLSQAINFNNVVGTVNNCSGTVTPWNTVVSCEESTTTLDANSDGRNDLGWCVEINPATKTVIDKLWALGNFQHENIVVHSNQRTVYQGVDTYPGYLYKFVADSVADLSSGNLYVYKGSKNGTGNWIKIRNTTPADQNSTIAQSTAANATAFDGIEDVEIGPTGLVYVAVKGESRVYRFKDSNPITGTTVTNMETYVGDTTYVVHHLKGPTVTPWGYGNDNLAFDGEGNLWVLQDGGNNYIWVVDSGHSQTNPKVRIFGRTPMGSEATGITFSPDYRFLFMSIQHPSAGNNSTLQIDAAGDSLGFDKSISLVITRPCETQLDSNTHVACNSFTWIDGKTYTSSNNTATDTMTNVIGCDSILVLNLTITKSTVGTDVQTACDSLTWIDGNTYFINNNTATDTVTNAAGCDSVVVLNLTISTATTGIDVRTACDSLTWIDGNTYFVNNNTATDTINNAMGCDSVITLNLTINTIDNSVTQASNLLEAKESGANYQWLNCSNDFSVLTGETNQTLTASSNGNFAVEITQNGCIDTSACYAITGIGILENDFGNKLLLYPNPTDGYFSVDMGAQYEHIDITILDLNAKVIQSKTYHKSQLLQLTMQEPRGVYLLLIESGDKKARIQLVKD